jgi:hypothetical protein
MASGMLLGALGGLGQGLVNQSQRIYEEDLKRMDAEIQAEREKRVEEAAMRSEQRQEGAQIRQEVRQAEAHRAQRQDDLRFATDPNNVGMLTQAQLAKQKAEDEYADSRSDTEISQAARKAAAIDQATYHDTTDYEGRRLTHEAARLTIEDKQRENADVYRMTKADEKKYDFLKEQYKDLAKAKNEAMDEEVRIGILDDMDVIKKEMSALFSKYGSGDGEEQSASINEDPQGIKREAKVKAIIALNPQAKDQLDDNLSLAQLDHILKMEQEAKQGKKKQTGLLSRGASGDF